MSSTIAGILLLVTYLAFIVYAMKGKNLMVGFFVLAIIWAAISGTSFKDILSTVIQGGIVGNAGLIFTIMFGAWFGRVLVDTGITSSIIRKAVELGGDKPLVVGILLSIVTAAIFTSSFGSGVVIAVGIIILPILMALGMPKVLAIVSFIMSIASGTIINAVYYNQLVTMIPGVEYNQIVPFCLAAIGVNELIIFLMMFFGLRKSKKVHNWAAQAKQAAGEASAPVISFVVPIIPVIMAAVFKWPTLPSFLFATIMALILTGRVFKQPKSIVDLLSKTLYDGFSDVGLLIGMLCMLHVFTAAAGLCTPIFQELLGGVIPSNIYVIVIAVAILSPIALFRGPLMWWGTGAATVALLYGLGIFPANLLFMLMLVPTTFMATAICPTQGWNMWAMGYGKISAKEMISTGFFWAWASCAICSLLTLLFA